MDLGPRRRPGATGVVVGLVLGLLVLYPLVRLALEARAAGWDSIVETLSGRSSVEAILHTLTVASIVTAVTVPLAAGLALLVERAGVRGVRALRSAILLPVVVPQFVLAFGWSRAYARSGLADDLLGSSIPGVLGPVGIVLVLVVAALPLAFLVLSAGIRSRSEPDLVRAARVSGASALTALRTITLPLLRRSVAGAAALVFVLAANSFAVPAVLGTPAGYRTMTTRIYQDLVLSGDPDAFARMIVLALGMVVIGLLMVGPVDRYARVPAVRTGGPAGATWSSGHRSGWIAVVAVIWILLTLAVAVPLIAVVLAALTRAPGLAAVPANWSLENVQAALRGTALPAMVRTLILAISAATALAVLGTAAAYTEWRRRRAGVGVAITLMFALPGSALAVALLLAYGRWLRGALLLILLAYLAKLWALAHRPVAGALDGVAPDLVAAARTSGASAVGALRTAVLPPVAPALISAWVLVFLFGVHELTMSSLLYGPGNQTLAVVVLNLQQLGDVGATAALATVMGLLVGAAALPLMAVRGWMRRMAGEDDRGPALVVDPALPIREPVVL